MSILKIILLIVGVLALVVAIVYMVGYFMPVKHEASVRRVFSQHKPEHLWRVLVTVEEFKLWRKDVKALEVQDSQHWTEISSHNDRMEFGLEVLEPGKKLTTRIMNQDLPFGGAWIFELKPTADGGTELLITEKGEVYNPLFRFMSRFVFGHDTTLKGYMKQLSAYLEQKKK